MSLVHFLPVFLLFGVLVQEVVSSDISEEGFLRYDDSRHLLRNRFVHKAATLDSFNEGSGDDDVTSTSPSTPLSPTDSTPIRTRVKLSVIRSSSSHSIWLEARVESKRRPGIVSAFERCAARPANEGNKTTTAFELIAASSSSSINCLVDDLGEGFDVEGPQQGRRWSRLRLPVAWAENLLFSGAGFIGVLVECDVVVCDAADETSLCRRGCEGQTSSSKSSTNPSSESPIRPGINPPLPHPPIRSPQPEVQSDAVMILLRYPVCPSYPTPPANAHLRCVTGDSSGAACNFICDVGFVRTTPLNRHPHDAYCEASSDGVGWRHATDVECVDVDECRLPGVEESCNRIGDEGFECRNVDGGFRCECPETNFEENGRCHPILKILLEFDSEDFGRQEPASAARLLLATALLLPDSRVGVVALGVNSFVASLRIVRTNQTLDEIEGVVKGFLEEMGSSAGVDVRDFDECVHDADNDCDSQGAICLNEPLTFDCACAEGFQDAGSSRKRRRCEPETPTLVRSWASPTTLLVLLILLVLVGFVAALLGCALCHRRRRTRRTQKLGFGGGGGGCDEVAGATSVGRYTRAKDNYAFEMDESFPAKVERDWATSPYLMTKY